MKISFKKIPPLNTPKMINSQKYIKKKVIATRKVIATFRELFEAVP